jgi:hypothetical protein
VDNKAILINHTDARIFIDCVTLLGLYHNGNAFTNQGSITIGAVASGNTIFAGIQFRRNFDNAGGLINIDRTTNAILTDGFTFANTGVMNIGASTTVPSILSSDGTGTFSNDTGGQIKGKIIFRRLVS